MLVFDVRLGLFALPQRFSVLTQLYVTVGQSHEVLQLGFCILGRLREGQVKLIVKVTLLELVKNQ